MVVYCVDVFVKSRYVQEFLKATEANHLATRAEAGNIRFDVLQSQQDSGRFFLYEVYASDEAVAAHKQTDHYLKWREAVAPWMEKPREGVKYTPHFPPAGEAW